MADKPKKLLDQVRDKLRLKNYSYATEKTYIGWIRRYIFFHQKRHPADMGKAEIEAFLTHLAVEGNVAPSTQNQALHALLFLYRDVLELCQSHRNERQHFLSPNLPIFHSTTHPIPSSSSLSVVGFPVATSHPASA